MNDDEPDNESDPETGHVSPRGDGECFVIAPIGEPRTETRRKTDGLLDEAIRPVIEDTDIGLDVVAPHEIAEAGSIPKQVIQRLLEAELVVADLTDLNPNVMYELAVRHAKGRPVVPIAEKGTSLPFDITTERTILYEDTMHGLNELKPKLEETARTALQDEEPDNPIYRAQQDFQMRQASVGDDSMQYVMNRLDEIESAVGSREGWTDAEIAVRQLEKKNSELMSELEKKKEKLQEMSAKPKTDCEKGHLTCGLSWRRYARHRTD